MNIGQASNLSGVSRKMIRHYEAIGLIPPAARSHAAYRRYGEADVQRLAFIRRARAAGFPTDEIRRLLSLWEDRQRPAREVRRLAQAHLEGIETRIGELRRIAGTLAHLIEHCRGGDRPECPILEALAGDAATVHHRPGTHPEGSAAAKAAGTAAGSTAGGRTGAR